MGASRGLSGHALSAIKMNLNEFKKNGIHLNDYLGVPKCSTKNIVYLPNCIYSIPT